MAVDLAKVSLWLVTLAKDHALTFVDHALRQGDSLVGLSRKQIEAFHWEPDAPRFQAGFETMRVREHVAKVAELRQRIREANESVPDWELRDLWDEAQFQLGKVRLFGDLVLAAFFEGEKPKDREAKRSEYANSVVNGETERHRSRIEEWRHAEQPLTPFHWEIEFPEVFERGNPGFDAMVGNPPFLKGSRISGSYGDHYLDWILASFSMSGGQADAVAYFFQTSFKFLKKGGCLGLLATQTISQGATRRASLEWIIFQGGQIFTAVSRIKWLGTAAVTVSRIHICRQPTVPLSSMLNGKAAKRISSFLFDSSLDTAPVALNANVNVAFMGFYPYGAGFTFDDDEPDASPLQAMERILAERPSSREAIFPYIGGEEFLEDPRQLHRRYAIYFGNVSESEAKEKYPELMSIVEQKVRPFRQKTKSKKLREEWWVYYRQGPALQPATRELPRMLMHPYVSSHLAFGFIPKGTMIACPHYAIAIDNYAGFAVLQSRAHEIWTRFFASSLEERLTYTGAVCAETFPFPAQYACRVELEAAGKAYYEYRAAHMVKSSEGLTKTYNRFHAPDERDPDILKLRELHAAMDRAVLDAYGWSDIPTDCKFLLDYEIDEEEWGDKKKPYRYRWPVEARDEVLARLLELNAERAKEEARVTGLPKVPLSTVERAERSERARNPCLFP